MEYAIGAIWVGLELLCIILFSGSFLQSKQSNKKNIAIIIIAWVLMCLCTNIKINQFLQQLFFIAICVLISRILFYGSFLINFFLVVIGYIFITALDTIAVYSMCNLLSISYNTFVFRKLSYITLLTADKFLTAFAAWILYRTRKKSKLDKYQLKWVQLTVLFPAVSAAMLVILLFITTRNGDAPVIIVVFAGILIIANIAMIYVLNSIEKAMAQEQDLRLLRQQISIQTENYGALKKNYILQRKSTHEFERHLQVLRDLLDRAAYETAQEYVRQLQADRALRVFCIASNNPVIDVVLNQKHQVATENGIKMLVTVNDLSSISIKADEVVVLLSNLLDNAIEACLKLEQNREIICSILKEDCIYISIRNTSDPVRICYGEISTTKQDATEHGYGLPAVKYILKQLKAEYTFAYNSGWFQFVAEIPD